MMSHEETRLRAAQMLREGRMLEAAWIAIMLQGAPDEATANEIAMVRLAFFRGAHALFDIMAAASQVKGADGDEMIDQIKAELVAFLKDKKPRENKGLTH
jgi:predicted DNA-binding ArsR family transcriptional regulator